MLISSKTSFGKEDLGYYLISQGRYQKKLDIELNLVFLKSMLSNMNNRKYWK